MLIQYRMCRRLCLCFLCLLLQRTETTDHLLVTLPTTQRVGGGGCGGDGGGGGGGGDGDGGGDGGVITGYTGGNVHITYAITTPTFRMLEITFNFTYNSILVAPGLINMENVMDKRVHCSFVRRHDGHKRSGLKYRMFYKSRQKYRQ